MTAPAPDLGTGAPVAAWHVRNKAEHCVNSVFQCVREACAYLDGAEERWPSSGLSRFYLLDGQPRDLPALRSAGIGRPDLPLRDHPGRPRLQRRLDRRLQLRLLAGQPRALLRAAGLRPRANAPPGRRGAQPGVAGGRRPLACLRGRATRASWRRELRRVRAPAPWVALWDAWARLPRGPAEGAGALADEDRDDARERLAALAEGGELVPRGLRRAGAARVRAHLEDPLGRRSSWRSIELPRLWWSPADGAPLGHLPRRRAARSGPRCANSAASSSPRRRRAPPTASRESLRARAASTAGRAPTPWRDGAYDVAVDLRVDTTFQQRQRHLRRPPTPSARSTAARAAPIAVFFPSYRLRRVGRPPAGRGGGAPAEAGRALRAERLDRGGARRGPRALPRPRLGLRRGDRPAGRPGRATRWSSGPRSRR